MLECHDSRGLKKAAKTIKLIHLSRAFVVVVEILELNVVFVAAGWVDSVGSAAQGWSGRIVEKRDEKTHFTW